MLAQTLVFRLFLELRESGVRLDLDHLKLMLRAIAVGYGHDEVAFIRLCRVLWLTTPQEQRICDQALDRVRRQLAGYKTPVETLAHPTSSVPSVLSPDRLEDGQQDISNGSGVVGKSDPMWRAVGIDDVEDLRSLSVAISARDYLPVSRRQVKQSLRYLRRMERQGAATEIDVRRTLNRVAEEGVFAEPVLTSRRVNSAEAFLLIDVDGSMVPFHAVSRRLSEVISETGLFRCAASFYFHDIPGPDRVYAEPSRRTSISLDVAFRDVPKYAFGFVVSDAGAARARLDDRRVQITSEFLKRMFTMGRRIVWLNPMPLDRWPGTSASRIAQLVPMFELSRQGLDLAIATLRGRLTASAGIAHFLRDADCRLNDAGMNIVEYP